MITYKTEKQIEKKQLIALYDSVGWSAYTNEPERLFSAVAHSLTVISAWADEQLVGLIRAVGDGQTILYIQDILVMEAYQNKGIGYELMTKLLDMHPNVRQKVLLTEDEPDVRHFYEKCQFSSCDKGEAVAFYRSY